MDNPQLLLDACIRGDEETACRLVRFLDGSDAHAVLSSLLLGAESFDEIDVQRVQASAPGRLAILSFFLVKRTFTLYTLNSPHALLRGLTPLGMAVYLNRLDFVKVLLEKGEGTVILDGIDSHRATPIMYAARDGNLEILKFLIRQGSRPNAVDCQYRSVLFYALSSSQCLWNCEVALRLRRAEALLSHNQRKHLKLSLKLDATEYISLASLYQKHDVYPFSDSDVSLLVEKLVNATSSSDLFLVHSLLFPTPDPQTSSSSSTSNPIPLLVNTPDENGWSPIHYCVTARSPSSKVLDALYLAGADLSLYTKNSEFTPLHALARYGGTGAAGGASFRLYSFIVHLVRDLGAPLSAVDVNGETCLHVAARYAHCADVLMAFLECDEDGSIRKIRNNEGLIAQQVAKPDFRPLFEPEDGMARPESAASTRTVKPAFSSSSFGSSSSSGSSSSGSSSSLETSIQGEDQFPPLLSPEKEILRTSLSTTSTPPHEASQLLLDLEQLTEQLKITQSQDSPDMDARVLEGVESKIQVIKKDGTEYLESVRRLVDSEVEDLKAAREVHTSLDRVIRRLEGKLRNKMEQEELAVSKLNAGLKESRAGRGRASASASSSPSSVLPSLRPISSVPSLIASGSASSHSSFASFATLVDLTALTTPANSPCVGPGEGKQHIANITENEVDFACALAAGSVTRRRRSSALGAIFDFDATLPPEPLSPLEEGVNLVSVPPEHVGAAILQQRQQEKHLQMQLEMEIQAQAGSGDGNGNGNGRKRMSGKRESWLNPYVRKANTDTLKTHLANLLEIERTLFGAEDDEREVLPSPSLERSEEDCTSWRMGVESVEEVAAVHGDSVAEAGLDEVGNFLDMMAEEHELGVRPEERPEEEQEEEEYVGADISQYLDLYITPSDDNDESDERYTLESEQRTVVEVQVPPALVTLEKVRNEASVFEEALGIAEKAIEHARYYLCQAERLMDKIFRDKENSIQAARLSFALHRIYMDSSSSSSSSSSGYDDGDTDSLFYRPKPKFSRSPGRKSGRGSVSGARTPESAGFTTPSSTPVFSSLGGLGGLASRFQGKVGEALRHKMSLQSIGVGSSKAGNRGLQQSRRTDSFAYGSASGSVGSLTAIGVSGGAGGVDTDASAQDDLRMLHRLLIRKVPKWLEASADEVDKSCGWIGILQAVVKDLQRTV